MKKVKTDDIRKVKQRVIKPSCTTKIEIEVYITKMYNICLHKRVNSRRPKRTCLLYTQDIENYKLS